MALIININCKHYSTFGHCCHPEEKRFWIFKKECILVKNRVAVCDLQEKYPRPKGLPPPLPPRKCPMPRPIPERREQTWP